MLDDLRRGAELREDRPHGVRAHEPRLAAPARGQQPLGEHVPALIVRGELDLVDGEEVDLAIHRHRLDGADPVVGAPRHALLFAGHQRHARLADARGDPIVDLAGEQPQRQADHPRVVGEHALDRAVRLPGVGGPEERGDRGAFSHRRIASEPSTSSTSRRAHAVRRDLATMVGARRYEARNAP